MNKKGVSAFDLAGKSVYWTISVVVLTGVILAFIGMLASYSADLRKVPEGLEVELISLRFTNSPDCFTYQDEKNGRIYPLVIDLSKFTQKRMGNCYATSEDPKIGFKQFNFALELSGKEVFSNNFGGKEDFVLKKIVYLKKENGLEKAILKIKVQEKI